MDVKIETEIKRRILQDEYPEFSREDADYITKRLLKEGRDYSELHDLVETCRKEVRDYWAQDFDKVRASRGILPEVWERRPYVRWPTFENQGLSEVRIIVDRDAIEKGYAGLSKDQSRYMNTLAGKSPGWVIERHPVPGVWILYGTLLWALRGLRLQFHDPLDVVFAFLGNLHRLVPNGSLLYVVQLLTALCHSHVNLRPLPWCSNQAIGEYPQFREGLLRLVSDMERFVTVWLRDNLQRKPRVTTVGFQLGPSLAAAETFATVAPVAKQFRNSLIYISIITTALLICGVILLLTLLI